MSVVAFFTVNDGSNPVSSRILERMRRDPKRSGCEAHIFLTREAALERISEDSVAIFDSDRLAPRRYRPMYAAEIRADLKPQWMGKAKWAVAINPTGMKIRSGPIASQGQEAMRIQREVIARRIESYSSQIHTMFMVRMNIEALKGNPPWGSVAGTKQPQKGKPKRYQSHIERRIARRAEISSMMFKSDHFAAPEGSAA